VHPDPPPTPARADLGDRDLALLELLASNASRPQIARHLSCSTSTVERGILDLRRRFDVRTTIEVVVRAVRAGLI
jgi:DNA-binding NarL/FixJ family response regulator